MSALAPDELVRLWVEEDLAPERAIGQLLQHVAAMQSTLQRQSQTIAQLRSEISSLSTKSVATTAQSSRHRANK